MAMASDETSSPASTPSWVDRMLMVPLSDSTSAATQKTTLTDKQTSGVDEGSGGVVRPLEFNVASLNVLAEGYLTRRSHPGLPDSYADVAFDPAKRRKLLLDTLERFCGPSSGSEDVEDVKWDILAIQELDLLRPDDPILPAFESWGYQVVRTTNDQRKDCCAIAFDARKFSLVKSEVVTFDNLATLQNNDGNENIDATKENGDDSERDNVRNYKKRGPNKSKKPPSELSGMVQSFLRRNSGVLAHLESVDTRESLIVTSVHLYWHPGYEYVKLCQSKYLLDRVAAFASTEKKDKDARTSLADASKKEKGTNGRIPTIICGDMNSKPGSIVHKLFVEPRVDARNVAPWRYFWDRDSEENYTEDENDSGDVSEQGGDRKDGQDQIVAESSGSLGVGGDGSTNEGDVGGMMSDVGDVSRITVDRENGQDPIAAEISGLSVAGVDTSKKEGGTGYVTSGTGDVSQRDGDRKNGQDPIVAKSSSGLQVTGGDNSEKEGSTGYMMSGLPSAFTTYCSTTGSNTETNDDNEKDSQIESDIAAVSDPGEDSERKSNPEKHPFLTTSTLPEANGDDISSNFDELKAAFNIKSDRLNEHITPQDYQHSTPAPPVKYMLDYTLNRFTRWLRILGIDAVLETIEQEHERTHGGKIAMFDRCKQERRTLITSSYKLLLRRECPPGAYLLDSKSTSDLLEQSLPALLRTHGVELSPCTFLTRCVVCNGKIHRVHLEEEKASVFVDHGAPDLVGRQDMEVFRCDGCRQGYWWDDRPSSSASRVFAQATKLLRMCLRGGVGLKDEAAMTDEKKRKEVMGAFDFVNVKEERRSGESTVREKQTELAVIEWLREERLRNPFRLRSVYAAQQGDTVREYLPFTNVTKEFVGCLDYVFFETWQFDQISRLKVPTSFRDMNSSGIPQGHLIPSDIWPSDHIAVGARLRLKRRNPVGKNDEMPKATESSEKTNKTNGTKAGDDATKLQSHQPRCDCGCVPRILSLFEMAELRKKHREKMKAEAAASKQSN